MELKKVYRGMENGAEIIQENFEKLSLAFYPVGCIYQSTVNTDPSSMFGGTWERIKGKVLVGVDEEDSDFSTSQKTGGEKTHTLTVAELAAHTHPRTTQVTVSGSQYPVANGTYWNFGRDSGDTGVTGGNKPHNNMPPYQTIYIWERTY